MANININIGAKQFLSFTPVSIELIRNETNSITKTLNYSNGTGQVVTAGQVLYMIGNPSTAGYMKISTTTGHVFGANGSISILIESFPTSTVADGTVVFQFDQSDITLNIDYNSRPEATDLNLTIQNRAIRPFTTAEFVNLYTDYDADSYTELQVNGTTTGYEYDVNNTGTWVAYTSGTWVPINNVARLRFKAADQNTAYFQTNPYTVKDSFGLVSN